MSNGNSNSDSASSSQNNQSQQTQQSSQQPTVIPNVPVEQLVSHQRSLNTESIEKK